MRVTQNMVSITHSPYIISSKTLTTVHNYFVFMGKFIFKKRIECRDVIRNIVDRLVQPRRQERIFSKPATPYYEDCYQHCVTQFRKNCFNFNEVQV